MGDNCPKGCKHRTFHFCMESGTHCDKHCICLCYLCVEERAIIASQKQEKKEKRIQKARVASSIKLQHFHTDDFPFPSEPE